MRLGKYAYYFHSGQRLTPLSETSSLRISGGVSRLRNMKPTLIALLALCLAGCEENERLSNTKGNSAKPIKKLTPEEAAVKATITRKSTVGLMYRSGPLKGGTAVLVAEKSSPFYGAYWVKNGTVYVANGIAKSWSPNIGYPAGQKITFNTVKTSVR